LPFDLWLETARQFGAYFDVPFWHLLDAFGDIRSGNRVLTRSARRAYNA